MDDFKFTQTGSFTPEKLIQCGFNKESDICYTTIILGYIVKVLPTLDEVKIFSHRSSGVFNIKDCVSFDELSDHIKFLNKHDL